MYKKQLQLNDAQLFIHFQLITIIININNNYKRNNNNEQQPQNKQQHKI